MLVCFSFPSLPSEKAHWCTEGTYPFSKRDSFHVSNSSKNTLCRAGLTCLHFSPSRTGKLNFARFWCSQKRTNSDPNLEVCHYSSKTSLTGIKFTLTLKWQWRKRKMKSFCRKWNSHVSIIDHSIMGKGVFILKEIKIFDFDNHFIGLTEEH